MTEGKEREGWIGRGRRGRGRSGDRGKEREGWR